MIPVDGEGGGFGYVHEEKTMFWPVLPDTVHSYGPEPEAKHGIFAIGMAESVLALGI